MLITFRFIANLNLKSSAELRQLEEFSRVLKKNRIFIFSIPMGDYDIFIHSEAINEKYSVIQENMLGIRNGVAF